MQQSPNLMLTGMGRTLKLQSNKKMRTIRSATPKTEFRQNDQCGQSDPLTLCQGSLFCITARALCTTSRCFPSLKWWCVFSAFCQVLARHRGVQVPLQALFCICEADLWVLQCMMNDQAAKAPPQDPWLQRRIWRDWHGQTIYKWFFGTNAVPRSVERKERQLERYEWHLKLGICFSNPENTFQVQCWAEIGKFLGPRVATL